MAEIRIFKGNNFVGTAKASANASDEDAMFDGAHLSVGEKLANGRYEVTLKLSVSGEELVDGVGEELAAKLVG